MEACGKLASLDISSFVVELRQRLRPSIKHTRLTTRSGDGSDRWQDGLVACDAEADRTGGTWVVSKLM